MRSPFEFLTIYDAFLFFFLFGLRPRQIYLYERYEPSYCSRVVQILRSCGMSDNFTTLANSIYVRQMCLCCKEEQLRDRRVTLNRCYNPDGERIIGPDGYLEAEIQEPAGCACRVCQSIV